MLQKHAKIVTGVLNLDGASPKAYHSCIRTMEEFGMAKKVLPTVLALILLLSACGSRLPSPTGTPAHQEPSPTVAPTPESTPYDGPVSPLSGLPMGKEWVNRRPVAIMLNNLKEAARTFNYLSENNLLNYEDFQQHVSDVDASVKAANQRITQINSELSTQKIIQKHCDSYRLCRKVIENAKSAPNPTAYRSRHQAEYQLHDSLKKELQDFGITKIPSSEKIQKRIDNLVSEKTSTIREKQELRKKQLTLDIIQQNFSALLNTQNIALSRPL